MPDTTPQPVTVTKANELAVVLQDSNLAAETSQALIEAFSPIFVEARGIVEQSKTIEVIDATHVTEIKQAAEARKSLAKVRVRADKLRKELKEESLRTGQAIQKVFNAVLMVIEPEETRLTEAENFAVRREAERKAKLQAERGVALFHYGVNTAAMTGLGEMTQADFDKMLEGYRLQAEQEAQRQRQAEADRIKAEQERAAEQARIRADNERLQKEARERDELARIEREAAAEKQRELEEQAQRERDAAAAEQRRIEDEARKEREAIELKAKQERDAIEAKNRKERLAAEHKANVERAEADAKLKAEREAREKLEREARERQAAEDRRVAAEQKALKKAAAAPDREKIKALATALRATGFPIVKSKEAKSALVRAQQIIDKAADSIEQLAEWE